MISFYDDIIGQIKQRKLSKSDVMRLKTKLAKKHCLKRIPTDIEILAHATREDLPLIKRAILTKPTRSISGVAVVAIMCRPHKCPHGRCSICPGGPASHFGDVPQSYTGKEPATMRAIRNSFDPYLQVFNRLEQYVAAGHVPDKVELIIMGGTFPSLSKIYQKKFITQAFKAMNDFSRLFFAKGDLDLERFRQFFELPGNVDDTKRASSIRKKTLRLKEQKTDLGSEHRKNESAKIRCVGLTLETRPDYGRTRHGNFALELGATRIELGIESVFDDVLKKIDRGHDVLESAKSVRELKDLGFKLNFHYMLGLPGSSKKKDLEGLRRLFTDPAWLPDMLKIYPCMVLKGTDIYSTWKKGMYRPLKTEQAADIICEFKRYVPTYCRIMRIQRDIPTHQTEAGVDRTNLRQYLEQLCKKRDIRCRCIRCREVGRAKRLGRVSITVYEYPGSDGIDFFIAAEDVKNDVLVGFARLRLPSQWLREEITRDTAIVRELHVYGEAAAVGEKTGASAKVQHQGWGARLLRKAEQVAAKHHMKKVAVISGVGVRPYYRRFGYRRQGPYMVKKIA